MCVSACSEPVAINTNIIVVCVCVCVHGSTNFMYSLTVPIPFLQRHLTSNLIESRLFVWQSVQFVHFREVQNCLTIFFCRVFFKLTRISHGRLL